MRVPTPDWNRPRTLNMAPPALNAQLGLPDQLAEHPHVCLPFLGTAHSRSFVAKSARAWSHNTVLGLLELWPWFLFSLPQKSG